jgi:16S rRNA (cytosine1402-N4)-methyltransferase
LLAVLPECLSAGGTAAILSYHSGEDRRVKKAFRIGPYAEISPDPILPTEGEIQHNPRARSAKLRWARMA